MKQISAFALLLILTGCFGKKPEKTGKEGIPMPEFNILLTDSITLLNTSNIASGKPIVLFYFSPYCPYCKSQTQEIIEEMEELKDIQFYFITSFPLPTLKEFIKIYQLNKFPNIISGIDRKQFVHNYFEVSAIPYTAIYGKDKKLNNAFIGKINFAQLRKVAEQ